MSNPIMVTDTSPTARALERFGKLTPAEREQLLTTTYAKQRADFASYAQQPGQLWDDKILLQALTEEEYEKDRLNQKPFPQTEVVRTPSGDFAIERKLRNYEIKDLFWADTGKGGFSPKLLAEYISKQATFKKHPIKQRDALFTFNSQTGTYEPAKQLAHTLTAKALGELYSPDKNAQTIDYLTAITPFAETPSIEKISLKNGVFNLTTGEFSQHSPNDFFEYQLGFNYNPNAKCPNFEKLISNVLPEPEHQETIKQIFAYTLYQGTPLQRAFMFYGQAGCGKSQVLNVLTAFIGTENTVSISLQDLEERTYSRAGLFNRFLNVCADIPSSSITQAPVFKGVTGGDRIHAENKYEKPFDFWPFCKLAFSANELPRTYENPEAWASRWVFVPFGNRYRDKEGEIREIWKTAATDEELSGIFNLVYPYLKPLLENGKFKCDKSIAEKVEEYRVKSDPAYDFLLKWFEPSAGTRLLNAELRVAFGLYTRENKTSEKDEAQFLKEFRSAAERQYGTEVWFKKSGSTRFVEGLDFTEEAKAKIKPTPKTPETTPKSPKPVNEFPY